MPAQTRIDFSDAEKKLGLLKGALKPAMFLPPIAHSLFLMSRHAFEQQASPEGAAWAPLSPRYAGMKARLFPGKGILQRRGGLLRSLFETVEGNTATIGETMPYAAIHFYGGLAGRGHKAKIPARPSLPAVETAAREAQRVGEEVVQDAIERAGLS